MALGLVLWSVLPCDSGPIVSMGHRPMGQGTHGSLYLGHRSILAVTASRWAFGCEYRVEFPKGVFQYFSCEFVCVWFPLVLQHFLAPEKSTPRNSLTVLGCVWTSGQNKNPQKVHHGIWAVKKKHQKIHQSIWAVTKKTPENSSGHLGCEKIHRIIHQGNWGCEKKTPEN